MIYDLQKASLTKRLSAYLFDLILLMVLIAGCAWVLSTAFNYDSYNQQLTDCYAKYEQLYDVKLNISQEEYDALTPEQIARTEEAYAAFAKDPDSLYAYNMIVNLAMMITAFSVLLAYLVLEFFVPLRLGNGMTLGKKIFGIGVMRTGGIKINGVCLFIRTILGKYTVETMVPVFIVLMILFGGIGMTGTLVLVGLAIVQVILMIATRTNALIHDKLADTVVVDIASQMIFNTPEDKVEYIKRISAEEAARKPY